MFNLNLKIAIRYLLKNKLYSLLNIFGLALGSASFIIISLYVSYERSFDTFEGSDQVYRVYMDYLEGENFVPGDAQTYNLTGPTLKKEFPEIIEQVRLYKLDQVTFKNEERIIEQPSGALADETYFDIFNYTILEGDVSKLRTPNTIALTETLSKKLFGNENAIGKTITLFYESELLLEVVAVFQDIPQNTHFKTNYLISFNTMNTWSTMDGQRQPNWSMNNFFTYIKLVATANAALVKEKIIASDYEQSPDERHNIEAISSIHLYSNKPYEAEVNGSISRIRFLSAIAIIIILLSWLNYVNLSIVKSMERAREIGIRKVAGAQRPHLILQSLIESLLLNGISMVVAFLLVAGLLPVFNVFLGKSLTLEFNDSKTLLPFLIIILFGTLASGIYPAFVISTFSPIKALKGKLQASKGGIHVRKGLITLQFLATIILIVGTLIVAKQIAFLKKQPLGVELAPVIALKGELLESQSDSILNQKIALLQNKIEQLPFVEEITTATTYPGDGYDNLSSQVGMTLPNGTENERLMFYFYSAKPSYFDLMGLHFLAGTTYIEKNITVRNFDIVINETFARKMGFTNMTQAIGKTLKFMGETWKIAGIVEDYHHFGLKNKIEPLLIGDLNWAYSGNLSTTLVKLNTKGIAAEAMKKNLDQLSAKWKEVFPKSTLNFTFLDKKFEAQYREDTKFGTAFKLFTGLAIFIAGLGLFGLTSYNILQRKKEIGIRKISGASMIQILFLLNKDFLKLVGVSFLLATPIAWYVMKQWLQGFAYQTTISWWIFVLAGVGAFFIAIFSVSLQAIKAATSNPVNALKTE